MKPYLVRARITDLGPAPEGAMVLYIAMFDTEREALEAVKKAVPSSQSVEEVVGIAADSVVKRRNIGAGSVELLA